MSRFLRIAALLVICFGIFTLVVTIRNTKEKIILDRITRMGSVEVGIIERIEPKRRVIDEVQIRVNQETIIKEVFSLENFHKVGDSVDLYHSETYPKRYVFTYENIETLSIVVGITISLICFSPVLLFFRRKNKWKYASR